MDFLLCTCYVGISYRRFLEAVTKLFYRAVSSVVDHCVAPNWACELLLPGLFQCFLPPKPHHQACLDFLFARTLFSVPGNRFSMELRASEVIAG